MIVLPSKQKLEFRIIFVLTDVNVSALTRQRGPQLLVRGAGHAWTEAPGLVVAAAELQDIDTYLHHLKTNTVALHIW